MESLKQIFSGSTNIYETVAPLYYLLKFFGLAPIYLDLKHEKCGMRLRDYVVTLLSIVVYLMIFISAVIDKNNTAYTSYSLLESGWIYQYLSILLTSLLMVFCGFLKRKNMRKYLDLIYYFDETVDNLNWSFKVNHSKDRMKIVVWIVISLLTSVSVCILLIFSFNTSTPEILREICYISYVVLAQILVLLQFIFSSCAVKMRYELLTKNMR